MDIEELKNRFRHKRKADLSEIDLALKAVPFLLREVERLEMELKDSRDRIGQLNLLLNKPTALAREGKRGDGSWKVRVDDEKNRVYLSLSGRFDYQAGKVASNSIIAILGNLREGADAVNDLRGLKGFDRRALFHLRKILYTFDYVGVRRVVQLLGQTDDLRNALRAIHPKEPHFQISTAKSVEEAEDILDSSRKFLRT
jgi:hypothetical protein